MKLKNLKGIIRDSEIYVCGSVEYGELFKRADDWSLSNKYEGENSIKLFETYGDFVVTDMFTMDNTMIIDISKVEKI